MLIGRVVGAFGVHGHLKVELLTDFPDRFYGLSSVFLGEKRTEVMVRGVKRHKRQVLLDVAGVETPEDASALRGQEVYVPRTWSVPLAEDQFYLEDVIGIEAESDRGEPLGHICDVIRTGSNDVFVIQSDRGDVLVPATREAVVKFDLTTRSMVVASWVLQDPL